MVIEEIVLYIKIMEELSFPTIINTTIFILNLKSNNQFQELPGDVGVNTGSFPNSNGFHIDPRSSDTPQDFTQNNGHQLFYGTSLDLNNSNTFILDGSYKYNKSEGHFISSSFPEFWIQKYQPIKLVRDF